MNKKITFIIVTWNNNDCILDCINSIYKYCSNFKILIVDNDSSDNTVELILKQKYENCSVIELKENVGFAVGNNIGLDKVTTEYICYLNPDTILIEDIIEPSIRVLENNKEIGIVGSKLLNKDLSLQPSTFNFLNHVQIYIEMLKIGKIFPNFIKENSFPNESKSKKSKIVDWVIGAEMIMRTDDAKKIKGFSTEYYMYAEDLDLCKKMKDENKKYTYYLANSKLIHIGGVSEAKNTNYKKMEKVIINKLKFVKKFYGEAEEKKASIALYNSYKIRLLLLRYFYFWNKEKRKIYSDKMKMGLEISMKEKKRIEDKI